MAGEFFEDNLHKYLIWVVELACYILRDFTKGADLVPISHVLLDVRPSAKASYERLINDTCRNYFLATWTNMLTVTSSHSKTNFLSSHLFIIGLNVYFTFLLPLLVVRDLYAWEYVCYFYHSLFWKTSFTFHSTLVFVLVMFCSHVFEAMIGLWSKVLASHTWDY